MMGKPLLDTVSRDELMAMREKGMTNAAIAKAVNVSYQTVLKTIGPQPKGIRKPPTYNEAYSPNIVSITKEKEQKEERPGSMLVIARKEVKLTGLACDYVVSKDSVCFFNNDTDTSVDRIPLKDLETFIEELKMILGHRDEMTAVNEQW